MNIKQFCRALILVLGALSTNLPGMNFDDNQKVVDIGGTKKKSRVVPIRIAIRDFNGTPTLVVPIPVLRDNPESLNPFQGHSITAVKIVRGTGKQRDLCLSSNDLMVLATYFPGITNLDLSNTRLRTFLESLSSFFPRLTSLSLRNNKKLPLKLGAIIYSDLAKRLRYLDISDTTLNFTDEELKKLFPNALVVRDTQNSDQQETTSTASTTTGREVEQPGSTTTTTSTSRDLSLPPLQAPSSGDIQASSSNPQRSITQEVLQKEDTPCVNSKAAKTRKARNLPIAVLERSSLTPVSMTLSSNIPQSSNATQPQTRALGQNISSAISTTSGNDATRSLLQVIPLTGNSRSRTAQVDATQAGQAAKRRCLVKTQFSAGSTAPTAGIVAQEPTSPPVVSRNELKNILENYLNEYVQIIRDSGSMQAPERTHLLNTLFTNRLPKLVTLLTNYRNNGHILDSLLSQTTGLAHTAIEYGSPEILNLVIALEPSMLQSTHYANGYNPLELLFEKYAAVNDQVSQRTGLALLAILLKALQENSTLNARNIVTRRAVQQALQHGCFIRALVKVLVRIAYNDDKFKTKLILMSGQDTYTFNSIRDELLAFIEQYAGIPIPRENQELIRNELQDIMRTDYLNPAEEQKLDLLIGRMGEQRALLALPLSLATSLYMLQRWIS